MSFLDLSRLTAQEWAEQYARVRRKRDEEAAQARRERWRDTRQALLAQGLSARHLDELADPAQVTEDTPGMRAIADLPPTGISGLAANVGAGKTYAAHCWLLRTWQDDPADWSAHGLRMVTASEFARRSRYKDKFSPLVAAKRLVIDDLGVEFADPKGSFLVDLDELVDLRWRAKLPVLITTNLIASDFKARYGERIADRIRSEGRWISCRRESLRGASK